MGSAETEPITQNVATTPKRAAVVRRIMIGMSCWGVRMFRADGSPTSPGLCGPAHTASQIASAAGLPRSRVLSPMRTAMVPAKSRRSTTMIGVSRAMPTESK